MLTSVGVPENVLNLDHLKQSEKYKNNTNIIRSTHHILNYIVYGCITSCKRINHVFEGLNYIIEHVKGVKMPPKISYHVWYVKSIMWSMTQTNFCETCILNKFKKLLMK